MEGDTVIYKPDSSTQLLLIAAVVLLTLFIILVRRRLVMTRKGRRLDKILRNYKQQEVRSIVIPDGIGGLLELDRLILTERGLLVIETYPMTGHLFGAEQIDQWTQIIDGRSFKFANPLHHIQNAKYALQQLAPKVPIFYLVVFTGDSDFPKGKPDYVSTLQTLEQDLQAILEAPKMSDSSLKAWNRILRIGRKNGQAVLREVTS
ncbi:nuclease-related domain-containing protein [Methylophaga sp.]|jgi:hypothetical protein|uniref:nuclease-related domain-containing protein n=1 Tax=Methylophaga sp. TaxID=2024840 RepID=UPI001400FBAA|nr:nuclease-related domain-containing protein [Methylophaga sp.]MTI64744.1 NERD domain-containing protein [Methylophaga sp.]